MDQSIFSELNQVAQAIYDKKGFNILVLDVRNVCTMTDYFIIAEGTVDRHVKALTQTIVDQLAQKGIHPLHVEGEKEGDWVVLDYGYFVAHLFIPDLREKYALEELWKEGSVINVQINTAGAPLKNKEFAKSLY
ncbi:ribosome silencing factor [Parachlamydia sp. C2]|uniref:ribosome silencing factor n=1 Tax=Candidatus Protochlamydia phocaeensis TaxID=1414722 RepID=UPI0008388F62